MGAACAGRSLRCLLECRMEDKMHEPCLPISLNVSELPFNAPCRYALGKPPFQIISNTTELPFSLPEDKTETLNKIRPRTFRLCPKPTHRPHRTQMESTGSTMLLTYIELIAFNSAPSGEDRLFGYSRWPKKELFCGVRVECVQAATFQGDYEEASQHPAVAVN